jgi:tetratricopeptide (TPR) repeat protein
MKTFMIVLVIALLTATAVFTQDKISGTDIDKFHKTDDPSPSSEQPRGEADPETEDNSQSRYAKPSKRQEQLIWASGHAVNGQFVEAEAEFRAYLQKHGKDPYAHWMLGSRVFMGLRRWEEALQEVDLAFKYKLKEGRDIQDLTAAYKFRNDLASFVAFNRGQTAFQQRDWNSAVSWYLNTIRIDPSNSNAFFNAGLCYENLGNYTAAIHYIESAIALAPEEETFRQELARLTGHDNRDPIVSEEQSTPLIRLFQKSVVRARKDIIRYESDRLNTDSVSAKAFDKQQISAMKSGADYFNFCIVALRDNTSDAQGCRRFAETAPRLPPPPEQ